MIWDHEAVWKPDGAKVSENWTSSDFEHPLYASFQWSMQFIILLGGRQKIEGRKQGAEGGFKYCIPQ